MAHREQSLETLGGWLRRHRERQGLSREELAARTEPPISPDTIANVERGRTRSYKQTLEILFVALGLDAEGRSAGLQRWRALGAASSEGAAPLVAANGAPAVVRSAASPEARFPWRNNLPVELSSFVGREREVVEIKQILRAARLVNLTGPGGVGKTRLALRVAAEIQDGYPEGAWFVDLAPLADGALVPRAVGSALGVREEPSRPIADTLVAVLGDQRVLLILDNCEQLVEACAALANRFLRDCPRLRLLATSREAFHIAGETVWRVPCLSVPKPPLGPPDELQKVEAVQLFVERATAAQPGFCLTNQHAPAVVEICRRLDGIPLALELAAARVDVLSPAQIAARLDQRFQLLTTGGRIAPLRHRTLWDTVAWSHGLLAPGDQRLFRRLAVFAGGCTLAAAEVLCEADDDLRQPVLDGLTSLVAKNLLRREDDIEGEPRFGMLETIREFALERLTASGEEQHLRQRHAACFMTLAESAELQLWGHGQADWLARLEREHDNLRAALHWMVERGEAEKALRMASALSHFWEWHGHLTQGREHLTEVLGLAQEGAASAAAKTARATALYGAGNLAWLQGDYAAARTLLNESLAIRRTFHDRLGIALSLGSLAEVARLRGDYQAARLLLEESVAIARELGDKPVTGSFLNGLGNVARLQGDYGTARAFLQESLAIGREIENQHGISFALTRLGEIARVQGEHATARSLVEEGLAIGRKLGDRIGVATALATLGEVARLEGDFAVARTRYEESLTIRRDLGNVRGIANSLKSLGELAQQLGDNAAAESLFMESLVIGRGLGNQHYVAHSLEGLASVAAATGRLDRALRLAGAAAGLRASIGAPLSPRDMEQLRRWLQTTDQALSEDDRAAAWAAGQAMLAEEAFAYALEGAHNGD